MTDNIEREKLAAWMIRHSFSTGHGDTIEDLLGELSWQVLDLQVPTPGRPTASPSQPAAGGAVGGIDKLHEFVLFVAGQPHYPLPFPDDGIDRLGSLQSRYTNIVLKAEKLSGAKDKNDVR